MSMDDQLEEYDSDDFNEGFILPPLIIQLKKILEQYPDDSQILKELIQNAEDAGARQVKFLVDHHSHGADPKLLHHPGLAKFQGPALYAYNDGLFDEDDWKGIRMLSQSVKQSDPLKVGYFGMGFKSVFHITDLPTIFSGSRIGVIDPHQKYFPASTYSWNVARRPDLLESLPHQFQPLVGIFGCEKTHFKQGYFDGSLFRFPLRRTASALSEVPCSIDKARGLYECFEEDAHMLLMFLKHLETIELYERDAKSQEPKLVFRVTLSDDCIDEVRQKRVEFLNQTRSSLLMERPLISTYPVSTETTLFSGQNVTSQDIHRWLVTNYFCGGQVSAIFHKLHRDTELNYPPWVGAAMPLDLPDEKDIDIYELTDKDGHVFCFLPLPLEQKTPTGLPVHVNGFFALEQNRKYIKWPSGYHARQDFLDKRLLWNQCMLKEALPKAYAKLLLGAIERYNSGNLRGLTLETIYRAFPDFGKVDKKWEVILPIMFSELFKHPVVFTPATGGQWIQPRSAIFNTVPLEEAARDVILEVLSSGEVKVATVPDHVLHAIKSCCHINLATVTPQVVAQTYKETQFTASIRWEDRQALLKYLLKHNKYDLLEGLELLPLANGGFQAFFYNPRRADRYIFIPSKEHPASLLPGLDDDILEPEIDDTVREKLVYGAKRGYTQLKLLDEEHLANQLPRCLPVEWKDTDRVSWTPGEYRHPPEGWLENLWKYLAKHCRDELTQFESLPILPTSVGETSELVRLSSSVPLIAKRMDGLTMPDELDSILTSIGISVIQHVPDYIQSHPLVNKHYVFSPSYMGVLKSLHKLTLSGGIQSVKEKLMNDTSNEEKRELQALLSKVSTYELTEENRELLEQLPLFETVDKSGGKESHFVSCSEVSLAGPQEMLPVPVSKQLLDISSQASNALAKLLNIQQLNVTALLTDFIFPDIEQAYYETDDVEKAMLYVLRHYHSFVEADSTFKETLRGLPFLPKRDMLVTAERFYDPDHELLQKLFLGEENFPKGPYAEPSMIAILREAGLRGVAAVEPEDIEETAYVIQEMLAGGETPIDKIVTKSNALMAYLQQNESKLTEECQGEPLYKSLKDIKWMRCQGQKPSIYPESLSWYQADDLFDKPCNGTSKQYSNIIGSVKAVVAADETLSMSHLFGWDDVPEIEAIVEHFTNTIWSYNGSEKAKYVEIVQDIYKQLCKHSAEGILSLLDKHGVSDWVWTGDGFISPGCIVFEKPFMDLRPFVFAMPSELTSFSAFLSKCGVKDYCNLPDVLHTIKAKYDANGTTSADDKRDLHICISILNELKSTVTESNLPALQSQLVLPLLQDNKYQNKHVIKMAPLADCTYCDKEWLKQGHDIGEYEEEEKLLFVHPNLPTSTSSAVGVPTLMSRMLDAEELDFSFGQTDSLTHRLNILLQEYTDGFAVPKELIQNADDAGATEVKILYDERQNLDARTCLIDEGMKECQGPAVWAYNNAVFTDEDFENITKLCGATKESQTDKIGRFGLGFNAVYNLTDVPSFVSRQNIAIFDPHTTYLGKSIKNKARPGIKIDILKHRRKLRRLGNQFMPYNDIFGCDLRSDSTHEGYEGTLFRFPLRTKAQAIKSEICQRHYDDKEVRLLLQKLMKGAESLLMFTQNVIDVSVYHLPSTATSASQMREMFKVSKRPLSILRFLSNSGSLPTTANALSPEIQTFIGQCGVLKASTKAMQQIKEGADVSEVDTPNSSMVMEVSKSVLRDGERILETKTVQEKQPWLIANYMGKGESMNMALQEDNLMPTGAVAVPLRKTEFGYVPQPITYSDSERHHGTVFTYLPLPIRTGLPIHINAAFAITSNRRYLCERNEDDKFDMRAIWNEALLEDAVCKSYINMLGDLASLAPANLFEYNKVWPHPDMVESNSKHLLQSFYRCLTDSESSATLLASRDNRWVSMAESVFLDADLQNSNVEYTALDVFTTCQEETNCSVVSMLDWVRAGFESSQREEYLREKSFDVVRFFKDILLPNIDKIEVDQRDQLMIYGLKQNLPELNEVLKQHACIPVTPDGENLCKPERLIDPDSQLADLYSAKDGRFPYGKELYGHKNMQKLLLALGMATEKISWEDAIERAESTREVDYSTGRKRVTGLLAVVERKLSQDLPDETELKEYKAQLEKIQFLPTMKKPETFPLCWKGDELGSDALLSPSELYPSEKWSLVSCVEPIVDETVFPKGAEKVNGLLGLKHKTPKLETVLEQLSIISDPDTESYLHNRDVLLDLQKVCYDIYAFLQHLCHKQEGDDHEVEIALHGSLKAKFCILCHNRFLSPRQLAFNFPHNCDPYLFSVPDSLKRSHSDFLRVVGVKDHFDSKDYVFALQNMHDVYGDDPLDKASLKLALRMVNLLNDTMADLDQTITGIVEEHGTIFIPDANGVLASASTLCFNEPDCQWVPTAQFTNYSHPLIPFTISKQLGVNTRRQEVLKKHSKGLAFGQRERLTNRLKRILSGYPCDKEILKEMLQNADDAGASEIHFINDPRQHPSERVFDDIWKPLQGPSLCVYNDKPFSQSDLEGIQRLGEGTKSTDPNKTGQYGVGFNCVYHLTDAPSFLTASPVLGETLCVFDPHAKFIPGSSVEEPGRRYDEVAELREIFTDVFPCYLEDKYDLSNATMFRLPLRNPAMAASSELSDKSVDSDFIAGLLSKFKPELFDCLLFMKHVNSITLTEVHKLNNRLTNTYTVTSEISDTDNQAREEFAEYVKEYSEKVQRGEINAWEIPPMDVSYTLTLCDNEDYTEKWLVTQRIGFENEARVPGVVTEAFKRQDLALLPRGGVAALLHTSDPDSFNRPRKAFCFLPLPIKMDLPVNINGHFALDHEARRNLWYDEDAGPKTEWNKLIMKNVVAPAYVSLLRRAPSFLGSSFINPNLSLMEIYDDEMPSIEVYGTLFPAAKSTEPYHIMLVEGTYQHIHNSQEPVLPVVRTPGASFMLSRSCVSMVEAAGQAEIEWLSTSGLGCDKPYFDNLDDTFREQSDLSMSFSSRKKIITSTPKKKARSDGLKEVLLSAGFKLVRLPLEVYEAFLAADVPVECISPGVVVDFFKSYREEDSNCVIGTLPASITDTPFRNEDTLKTVLEYCLHDSDEFYENIDGLPLLLCEDSQLRAFKTEDPVYLTTYYDLIPECSSMFMHHLMVNKVFKGVYPDDIPVMQRFDVQALSSLIVNAVPRVFHTAVRHVSWKPDEEDVKPSAQWIWNLWNFLREEYERILSDQPDDVDERKLAAAILKPLQKWCLMPAFIFNTAQAPSAKFYYSTGEAEAREHCLVPIGLANTVLDFSQAMPMSHPMRDSLRRLGMPELASKLIDGGLNSPVGKANVSTASNANFARLLVATLDQPKSPLATLKYAVTSGPLRTGIKAEECMMILKYFSDCVESWKDDNAAKRLLKSLPVFQGINGNMVSIDDNTAYVLPREIPNADMAAWEKQAGICFLRFTPGLEDLYNAMGCTSLSVTEVYTRFVFGNFATLGSKAKVAHLSFIKDAQLPLLTGEVRDSCLEALRGLDFLKGEDGTLKKACDFYDPYHPVFKMMLGGPLAKQAFPPAPFDEFGWLEFMRLIGLQHEVSRDQLILFAQQIEHEAEEGPTEATFDKARTLVTHLFRRQNLATEGVLEDLRNVRFIPAAKVNSMLQKIATARVSDKESARPYIAFKDGVSESHEFLIWTSGYMIPDWANPFKLSENTVSFKYDADDALSSFENYQKEIANLLGILEDPPVEAIIEHIQNICDSVFSKTTPTDEVKAFMKVDVMKKAYKFLQDKYLDIEILAESLEEVCCIVVDLGYTFVRPKQVVINLYEEDQIMPYLYKLPTELGEFKDLFLTLGVTLNATVDQYAWILESIYVETNGEKLHPNELRLAFKAVYELFTILQKHPKETIRTEILFLPSSTGHLIQSTDLVFNNDPTYTERIKHFTEPFLVDLAECHLSVANYEDLIKLLPAALQPSMLTDLVHEVLEEESRKTIISYGIAEKLRHQLNSRAFSIGVVRLIRHEHHRAGQRVQQRVLDSIQDHLKNIRAYGAEKVMTYLTYEGARIPGSETQTQCFVDKTFDFIQRENIWNIYIDHSVSMNEELLVSVAEVVNRIVGGMLKNSVHYLQPILSCPPHSISSVLDRLKIRQDHSVDFKQPTLPDPGTFVPLEDHHLLKEEFEEFEAGEYVALELEDDVTGGQMFIYAIIVEKYQDKTYGTGLFLTRYKVNIGDERKPSLAIVTDLYKFHRVEGFVSRNTSAADRTSVGSQPTTPKPRPSGSGSFSEHDERLTEEARQPNLTKSIFERYSAIIAEEAELSEDNDDAFHQESGAPHTNGGYFQSREHEATEDTGEAQASTSNGFRDAHQAEPEFAEAGPAGSESPRARRAPPRHRNEEQTEEEPQGEVPIKGEGGEEEPAPQPNIPEMNEGMTLQDLMEKVSDTLEEAWKLPDKQRKKVIKRVLLKWHPDKNIGNEQLATVITQHIGAELERIEQGMPRPSKFDEFDFQLDPRNPFATSDNFKKNFYNAYQFFFDQVNKRAKEHKEQRERYKEHFSKEYSSSKGEYNFDVPPSFANINPQPAQAKRFLRQAQEDLRAADNDYEAREPAYEWVCFKSHQAAEKALKAAQFAVDAATSFSHDLTSLAALVEDLELRRLAIRLQSIIGNSSRLYNPDPIDFVVIPHDEFTKDMACDSTMCAADILERAKEFVESKEPKEEYE